MTEYDTPYFWWHLTPLFPGEPIVSYKKDLVWFVKKPYVFGKHDGIEYEPMIIPLIMYLHNFL